MCACVCARGCGYVCECVNVCAYISADACVLVYACTCECVCCACACVPNVRKHISVSKVSRNVFLIK